MILPDTSAWIEFLRRTGHPTHVRLRELLAGGEAVAYTEPIAMEVLAGARTPVEEQDLRARLVALELIPARGIVDFEAAAAIYRRCRAGGATIARLIDCLVAAVAIREDVPVLHNDADFETIARYAGLRTVSA